LYGLVGLGTESRRRRRNAAHDDGGGKTAL
jgi:hypothetical protein